MRITCQTFGHKDFDPVNPAIGIHSNGARNSVGPAQTALQIPVFRTRHKCIDRKLRAKTVSGSKNVRQCDIEAGVRALESASITGVAVRLMRPALAL